MSNRGIRNAAVEWYLPNKKKPFAYSTKAESDAIVVLLEEYGDLRDVLASNRILSPQEKQIIQTFVDHGVYKPKLR